MILSVELNSLLNLMSAAVALLVSYYAYKSNRLLGSSLLRYISAGFLLLGVGLAVDGFSQALLGLTPVDVTRFSGLEALVFVTDVVLQVVAYFVFAWGYALGAFGRTRQFESATAAAVLLGATKIRVIRILVFSFNLYLFAQLGIIVLMLFVVVQGVFVYARSGSTLTLTVLSGFVLILVAHGILFLSVIYLSANVYIVGTLIQFLGFLSLLYFIYRSSRIGTA